MNIELETQGFLQSVAELEQILEGECICESKHLPDTLSPYCNILAKYRITVSCIKQSTLICESLALADVEFMEGTLEGRCIKCKRPAKSCWSITLL